MAQAELTEQEQTELEEAERGEPLSPAARAAVDGMLARSIHERMLAILAELPAIGKDQFNEQQKFNFRGHDDVMNALNPLLAKHGVFVVPRVLERTVSERVTGRGSTMYEVNLHVEYTFFGAGGDRVVASTWGEGTDMGDKSTNKAMTGAFKNVLAQAFALATKELSDADAESPEETTRGDQPRASQRRAGRRDRGAFDPAVDRLEGALGTREELVAQQTALSPVLDWSTILREAAEYAIGKPRDEWDDADKKAFLTRWSNALVRVEHTAPDDVYHPDLGLRGGEEAEKVIVASLGWAFNGWAPEGALPTVTLGDSPEPGEVEDAQETAADEATDAPEAQGTLGTDDPPA